jgi:hypothetical protein
VPVTTSPSQQMKNIMCVHLNDIRDDNENSRVKKFGWYSSNVKADTSKEGIGATGFAITDEFYFAFSLETFIFLLVMMY